MAKEMTGPEIVAAHNELAEQLGEKTVKKFRNKETGLARLAELQARVKSTPQRRGGPIDWPVRGERHKVREGSLGDRFIKLMKQKGGTTLEQLEEAVEQHDAEHEGTAPSDPTATRVRSMLRMLHTYNGFGIKEVKGTFRAKG
jgi:hypothetical protein